MKGLITFGDDLLTEAEAARFIGTSLQWLRYRRKVKKICPPYILVDGRIIRYSKKDLTRWLEDETRFVKINPNDLDVG